MNVYPSNKVLIQLYIESGLKKVDFAKLIEQSDSYTCDLLKCARRLNPDKLKEIQNTLKRKEMKKGSLVRLKTAVYPNDKYNPRELNGMITIFGENKVVVKWENGINNSYSKNELILVLK
jgi:hypothetical protein